MPRPPLLPTIDWKAVFASGQDYPAWLQGAEFEEQREKLEAIRRALSLEPEAAGFLAALHNPVHVVAIAEAWCGDVLRHVPVLQKMADAGPMLRVRYITRQQWPEVFTRFLTNGGESIPKFIFLSQDFVECGNWGPMPNSCREIIARGKACGDIPGARRKVSLLYAADPQLREVIPELLHLVDIASSREP
jgi:hypothetical protein